jgi:hypothetical protein
MILPTVSWSPPKRACHAFVTNDDDVIALSRSSDWSNQRPLSGEGETQIVRDQPQRMSEIFCHMFKWNWSASVPADQ